MRLMIRNVVLIFVGVGALLWYSSRHDLPAWVPQPVAQLLKPNSSSSSDAADETTVAGVTTQNQADAQTTGVIAGTARSSDSRIVVYQSKGRHGEAVFSDTNTQGRARVVDQRLGSDYSASYGGQVPQSASVSYDANPHHPVLDPVRHLRQESLNIQQRQVDARHQQMQAATHEN